MNCSYGGKLLYDCDGCGHEWLDCKTCGYHLETYENPDIHEVARQEQVKQNNGRRYLVPLED